jgi:hypothetical protein
MARTIQSQDMENIRLKMELEKYRNQVTIPIINTLPFDNFLSCGQAVEEDLYEVKLVFYIKLEDFMRFFIKFQGYVDKGKRFQASMEVIKGMVGDIVVFQEKHPKSLANISEMSPQ